MGHSCKVYINRDYVKADGTSAIYLRVTVDRVPKKIPLNLNWPLSKFSEADLCLPRNNHDKDYED
ncbi:hypothetical protein QQ008_01135 [Fulvivirgaceae bacterium BMA10]|uniref:Arm DNA-binding domain-containing protein n=1 Tax=Splendidivirga corallicola TaxID=3051826 RepID=A0ABT8KI52_9BACT|nr:hypothetical protein [Fulvivirgaceae bacterium BMA10]